MLVSPVWRDPVPVIAGVLGRGGESWGAGKPPLQARKDAAPVLGGDRGVEQMVVLPGFRRVADRSCGSCAGWA